MAFHPYPQLIPQVFNPGGFGPPRGLTRASTWPWVDHSASGLDPSTKTPCSDSLSLRLPHTGSPRHRALTRRLILQKARCHPTRRLQRIVGTRFQDLFHSPPGVLFTFPSRYLSAIGHQGIFRLSGWSRQIHTGFLGPRATWDVSMEFASFRLRG